MRRSLSLARSRRSAVAAATTALLTTGLAAAVSAPDAGAQVGPLPVVQDFEGSNVITTASPGVFPFGSNDADSPDLSIVAAPDRPGASADNHALDVPYSISSYGGFSANSAQAQDWSSYSAFSFWVKETGSGQKVEYEIKDGGSDGEHSELWQAFFTDSGTGWTKITTPFSDFVHRTDYIPPGSPADGVLNLTQMWGFAVNLPGGGASGDLQFDDVTVAGTAQPRVSAAPAAQLVDAGKTAQVVVTMTTADGKPASSDVTVDYTLGGGSAVEGTDFTGGMGSIVFPAGTASGTTKTIDVATKMVSGSATAKTIPVKLSVQGADLSGATPVVVINAHGYDYLNPKLSTAKRVADLMSHMSLADKIGQMTQAERLAVGDGSDITKYALGSLLSGGGSTPAQNTPAGWAAMIDGYQTQALATPLQIPMIYGIDSVHGDNNLVGATIFPHNVGMGATRDPALVKREGEVTATETRATGIPWAFASCICVARDERWGRNYESYSEDPALVTDMATPVFQGLQGDNDLTKNTAVLGTAKHFIGDGDTRYGTGSGSYPIDQGIAYMTPDELKQYLKPYEAAVKAGVGTVMPSYSSLQITGQDAAPVKMHARGDLINGVLKQKMGFKGFVISDYSAIDQIGPDYKQDVKISINAGLDMIMVPNAYTTFITDLTDLVNSGDVPMSRIDDAVSRILGQKFRLGLFDHPFADTSNADTIGSAAHRAVARQAAAESQVLLKNSKNLLPLAAGQKVYVAGSNADDDGNQAGGWTVSWQGQSGKLTGSTSILEGLKQDAPTDQITYSKDASADMTGSDVGIVVVGETPYAEGHGDIGNEGHTLQLSNADKAAVDKVCDAMKCAVLVVSGRQLDVTGIAPKVDALVASYLPGSEGEGVADVLTGARPFTGRLPATWFKAESQLPINVGDKLYDPLYPYGWGLRTDATKARLQTLRDELAVTGKAAGVVSGLDAALSSANWAGDRAKNPQAILSGLQTAANAASNGNTTFAQRDTLASVARDLVQGKVALDGSAAMTATAKNTANAEHQLMLGKTGQALALLVKAYNAA